MFQKIRQFYLDYGLGKKLFQKSPHRILLMGILVVVLYGCVIFAASIFFNANLFNEITRIAIWFLLSILLIWFSLLMFSAGNENYIKGKKKWLTLSLIAGLIFPFYLPFAAGRYVGAHKEKRLSEKRSENNIYIFLIILISILYSYIMVLARTYVIFLPF